MAKPRSRSDVTPSARGALLATCWLSLACAPAAISGTQVLMNDSANFADPTQYFDFPNPSDFRVDAAGHPDMTGFPNPYLVGMVSNLLPAAAARTSFPVLPVAYFRFTATVATQDPTVIVSADKSSPLLLVDLDAGTLVPVIAETLTPDPYTPAAVLAVSPPTGVILQPSHRHAFVVMRSLRDAHGALLGSPLIMEVLKAGQAPSGAHGAALQKLYQPLWSALKKLGVDTSDVAAATVFTTADAAQELSDLTEKVLANPANAAVISGLQVRAASDYPTFCALIGNVTFPQFQAGTPPFDTEGGLVLDATGAPVVQRMETVPLSISIPKTPMPQNGFPLMLFIHGSGDVSLDLLDRGYMATSTFTLVPGTGPASIIGPFGIAGASSAMPLNPERFPGATDYEYLNFNNPAAMPSTFRQGVIEQRLLLEALRTLQITPGMLTGCPEVSSTVTFDPNALVATGHSMGAMYLNMLGAVEPRIQAGVLSGAGGDWTNFIFETGIIPGASELLAALFNSNVLSARHPVMSMLEMAWEASEPIAFAPRLGRYPLPGNPTRPVFEPVGVNDAYFPEAVLDDMALSYGNQQVGAVWWSSLQTKLAIEGLQGIANYPVSQNRTSSSGARYTGVVVQHNDDGIVSGHDLIFQFDDVKHQYGCFLSTFLSTGKATLVAPGAIGSPCE